MLRGAPKHIVMVQEGEAKTNHNSVYAPKGCTKCKIPKNHPFFYSEVFREVHALAVLRHI